MTNREFAGEQPGRRAVKLHIERLVLHGFPAGSRQRIADHVRGELARLIGEGHAIKGLQHAMTVERAGGATVKMGRDVGMHTAGKEIARSIYRVLHQGAVASGGLSGAGPGAPAGGRSR